MSSSKPWSDLPIDLLHLILKRLEAIDILIFACVCKSWRSIATDCKNEIMESQPPLLLKMPKPAESFCYFFGLTRAHGMYKRALPSNIVGRTCVGLSCGYLFFIKDAKDYKDSLLLLVNPFTGHELHFPSPPNRRCWFILATCTRPYPQFVVIGFSHVCPYVLQFRRYGDDSWTIVDTGNEFRWIEDVAVYEGKAYVITSDARIGVLNLESHPHFSMLELQGNYKLASPLTDPHRLRLIASDEQLLIVDSDAEAVSKIHRLDFPMKQWIPVKSIGDQALFLGSIKCSGSISTSIPTKNHHCCSYCMKKQGRNKHGYYLGPKGQSSLNILIHIKQILNARRTFQWGKTPGDYLWYFPNSSFNVVSIF